MGRGRNSFDVVNISEKLNGLDIKSKLNSLNNDFGLKLIFSTNFSIEDQVITDIIFNNDLPISVFTLDTGRMFEESYKVFDRTIKKYNKKISVYYPENSDIVNMVESKGIFSFYDSVENRIECCNIRKVKPLKQALNGYTCWITGLRSEQSENRKDVTEFLIDENFGILKYNPIIDWSEEKVMEYIKSNLIPYNILFDKGFRSIGCEPCTRAINKGENIRSGRWWWEDKSKKECGLQDRKSVV